MKVITLLSGIMGVGKSTFIKNNKLEGNTVSTDTIRLLLGGTRRMVNKYGEVKEEINSSNDPQVFQMLYKIITDRMKKGEYIVVDAMNINRKTQKELKKLAATFRYRVNMVDIQGDMPLEKIQLQNASRNEFKVVPAHVVESAFKKRESLIKEFGRVNISGIKLLTPDEFEKSLYWNSENMNQYEKIVVIGDVHGCYTALKEGLGEFRDDVAYIFLGDLFDRGIENRSVLSFILDIIDKPNVTILEGNHETHIKKFLRRSKTNPEFVARQFLRNTIPEFFAGGDFDKSDLERLVNKLQTVFAFEFDGVNYIATHGGILPEQYNLVDGTYRLVPEADEDIISGIGGYGFDVDKFYNESQEKTENKVVQFHGHRNSFNVSPYKYKYIYNLEESVEEGGNLRIAEITTTGITIKQIKNTVFDKTQYSDTLNIDLVNLSNEDIKNVLSHSKYIRKSNMGKLTAYNFTNEAFTASVWTTFTMSARGLILKENGDIFARGYNKFFNIGENDATSLDNIKKNLAYPVTAATKANGYLGVMTGDGDNLSFFSKSGVTDYSRLFSRMFYDQLKKNGNIKNIGKIKDLLANNNLSVAIEVINVEEDKHIVKYPESKLVILDVIYNKYSLEFDDDIKSQLIELTGFEPPKSTVINNEEEFDIFYSNATVEVNTEGYVFKDSSNYMFKLKNSDYLKIKSLRGLLSILMRKNTTDFEVLPNWIFNNKSLMNSLNEVLDEYDILNEKASEPDMYKVRDILNSKVL